MSASASAQLHSKLAAQHFGGNMLNRSIVNRRSSDFLKEAFPDSQALLTVGRTVAVHQPDKRATGLQWFSPQELKDFGLEPPLDADTPAGIHPLLMDVCVYASNQ